MTAMGDTSIGGSRRDFPSTSWNLVRGVGKAHREHLERLIYLYWKPAYLYLRASGRKSVEDAKDPPRTSSPVSSSGRTGKNSRRSAAASGVSSSGPSRIS